MANPLLLPSGAFSAQELLPAMQLMKDTAAIVVLFYVISTPQHAEWLASCR